MRKAQKQEIMEMLQTLYEAHDEIKTYIDKKNYVLAQDILIQCQECAIAIGTAIEQFEGEGFVTVSYVESYCDAVFTCHEELNGSDVNANKIYKNLKKQLVRIENSVRNDIRLRKEIAFFPYKASMWDALESVYLAAKEDPDCDAYCVPIPYYDKNPDGSLGTMHYEGGEYPKNIDITDWKSYNFEERKPDVIYIHNPYDNWNLVTCVHSRYFSNNLKKYTEELVYIPYFILSEIEPDDQASIDGMKHFIWTPGVINADKVIVQSEKMKQIYVNEYLKAAKANGLQGYHIDRKKLEEKFLGLGSPKLDKVLNTKKEDLEIPQEWLKIIQKPDGSWKKIVFYNTSVGALLQHNESMLEKMKDVFKIFQENQDEVTLLWRPHPLIKATVGSMRPQLWIEYDKLVRKYREEGWGIYDDSSDVDRAIVLSDAYYGDGSSVVQMYQQTGKPVMMQNVDVINRLLDDENEICLNFRSCIRTEDKIYFANMEFNGLFEMSLDSFEITHIHTFGGMDFNKFFGVGQYIMKYHDNIFFLLNDEKQNKLCCYNLETKEEREMDFFAVVGTYYIFVRGNRGWIIPYDMSFGIYVMNLDTLRIDKDKTMSELLKKYKWGMRCVKQDEKTFSFIDMNSNEVIVVDVDTKQTTSFKLPIKDVSGFTIEENTVWMTQSDSTDVYEWDIEKDIVNKYVIDVPDLWSKKDVPYSDLIYIKEQDCVFLVGFSIGAILKTNRKKQTIEVAFDFPKEFRFVNNKMMYYSYFAEVERIGDELWFYPVRGNMILVYDFRKNMVRGIKNTIPMMNIPHFKEILAQEMKNASYREYEGIYSFEHMLEMILD